MEKPSNNVKIQGKTGLSKNRALHALLKSVHFKKTVARSSFISFKIVVIFNTTSAEIKTKSADVILKKTTILKEMRIVQMCSLNEQSLVLLFFI